MSASFEVEIDAPDWRTLDQAARDLGFNNSAAVSNTAQIVAEWDIRSAALREKYPATLDLAYGPLPRNRIDFLKAADGAPTLVFVHGGYWQMRAKENFTFCGAGPLARGVNVAFVGYTLAPDATLDAIVAEIHAALDYLVAHLPSLGGDPARFLLSGWSAGGHLTAMALHHHAVKAGVAISGLYDLEPIRHTYVNDKLGLDADAARRLSPLLLPSPPPVPLVLVAGSAELPLMRVQTADFAKHRMRRKLPTHYEEIPGANHFTVLDALAAPDGRITTLMLDLIKDL